MLKVQSEHLELQRKQLDEQHQAHEKQARVLGLQAREISASLEQRERDADEQRRSQAAKVTAWLTRPKTDGPWEACIRNASGLPIFDVRTFFHAIHKRPEGGGWEPVGQGGAP